MTYDCMTATELEEWTAAAAHFAQRSGAGKRVPEPCVDCPIAFRLSAMLAGTCARPLTIRYARRRGPVPLYSEDERRARHRERNREWMRAHRARVAA